MKAVIIYKDNVEGCRTAVVPDSAITRSRDPFFLPDDGLWQVLPLRGVVIDRLGKGIDRRFAHKYYNHCLTAAHPFAAVSDKPYIKEWVIDGALVVSPTETVDNLSETFKSVVDEMIETVSDLTTLKTGDLILFGEMKDAFVIENKKGDYFIEASDGCPPLKLKVR